MLPSPFIPSEALLLLMSALPYASTLDPQFVSDFHKVLQKMSRLKYLKISKKYLKKSGFSFQTGTYLTGNQVEKRENIVFHLFV